MESITKINLNLQSPNYSAVVYAVQGDVMSREITASLYDGQTAFIPPVGALGTVRYMKPDGTSGFYDTLEDEETVAVTWDGNIATIRLAEQALTVAGEVIMQLSFYSQDAQRLSAFNFRLFVEKNPLNDEEFESTDYYSVLTARIAAVLGAVAHAPQINDSGHWVLWDEDAQDYYDSGVDATGPQGIQGETGPQGVSITTVTKSSGTGAPGTTDVYNVNLSNSTVAGQFNVYNGEDGQGAPGSATPLMDGTAAVGTANAYSREDHVHPSDTSRAPTSHASVNTTYGVGSGTNYGHVQLSDSINSSSGTSGGIAATPSAVKSAYDLASGRQQANLYFTDVSVGSYAADSTYNDFAYRGTITLNGVTSSMLAEVTFAEAQARSGDYAPVCETYNGGVYIYSNDDGPITIPTIVVFK